MCIWVQKKNQKQIPKSYFEMQHYNKTFLKLIIDVNFSIDFKLCLKRNCKDIPDVFVDSTNFYVPLEIFGLKSLSSITSISKLQKNVCQNPLSVFFSKKQQKTF